MCCSSRYPRLEKTGRRTEGAAPDGWGGRGDEQKQAVWVCVCGFQRKGGVFPDQSWVAPADLPRRLSPRILAAADQDLDAAGGISPDRLFGVRRPRSKREIERRERCIFMCFVCRQAHLCSPVSPLLFRAPLSANSFFSSRILSRCCCCPLPPLLALYLAPSQKAREVCPSSFPLRQIPH